MSRFVCSGCGRMKTVVRSHTVGSKLGMRSRGNRNHRSYTKTSRKLYYRNHELLLAEDLRDPNLLRFDAHVHTDSSDGRLHPNEVSKLARYKRNHLTGIAITDHEYITGFYYNDGRVVNGIEVVAWFSEKKRRYYVHLTGIGLQSEEILSDVKFYRRKRREFYREVIGFLGQKVYTDLSESDIPDNITLTQGLWEISKFFVEGLPDTGHTEFLINHVHNEIIRQFNGHFYDAIWPAIDFVRAVHNSGGKVVFAHPGTYNFPGYDVERVANILFDIGVDGIEVVHPDYSEKDVLFYAQIAKQRRRLIVMGSDFHGSFDYRVDLYREYSNRLFNMISLVNLAKEHL